MGTAPPGPVDPYNCAVGVYQTWDGAKQTWCCDHHHRCGQPQPPAPPADPYNCADGFANWQAGWSVAKKEWCCRVHGKGCPNQGGGCVTSSEPYDCDAGFAQLDGRLVSAQEGLVLCKQGQRVSTGSRRLCMMSSCMWSWCWHSCHLLAPQTSRL